MKERLPQLVEGSRVARLIAQAVEQEREACAKACEEIAAGWETRGNESLHATVKASMARHCGYAIRARGSAA